MEAIYFPRWLIKPQSETIRKNRKARPQIKRFESRLSDRLFRPFFMEVSRSNLRGQFALNRQLPIDPKPEKHPII
jgi:hypothetical protein